MIVAALRPLLIALRLSSRQRRLNRRELIKLVADVTRQRHRRLQR
jgi:hypothetical protein